MAAPKSILITGAASGIGKATALFFAAKGWFVGAFDIDADGLERLRAEIGDDNAMFGQLDVANRDAVIAAVSGFGAKTGGKLDILFSNAGIDAKAPFEAMDWARIETVVNVNLMGAMSLIHAAIPLLKSTSGSLCLSTASASAIFGTANLAVYSATKHAVKGFTEALAVELAPGGVRVSDILPGVIDTAILSAEHKAMLPREGIWRVLPPEAIAETAWAAYHGAKLHWYMPEELAEYDCEITANPEATRDRRISGGF